MSDADVKPLHPVLTVKCMTPLHKWSSGWQAFRRAYAGWRLAAGSEPVYSLPEPAIDLLALARGAPHALLDDDDGAAEHEFTKLCRLHHAVGRWEDRPVWYDLLQPPGALPESLLHQVGWTPQEQREAQQLVAGLPERRRRLMGCAGWLLTEPAYLQETEELADKWCALPADQRPPFPLGRVLPLTSGNARRQPSPAMTDFGEGLRVLLDRWGLMQLATWDLPQPQGPLLPNLLPPGAQACRPTAFTWSSRCITPCKATTICCGRSSPTNDRPPAPSA